MSGRVSAERQVLPTPDPAASAIAPHDPVKPDPTLLDDRRNADSRATLPQ